MDTIQFLQAPTQILVFLEITSIIPINSWLINDIIELLKNYNFSAETQRSIIRRKIGKFLLLNKAYLFKQRRCNINTDSLTDDRKYNPMGRIYT